MGNLTSPCYNETLIVCDCTHEESEHNIAGGCLHRNSTGDLCTCTRYSQIKLKKRGQDLTAAEQLELKRSFELSLVQNANF